jgi:CheY-like chemotaxis protein
VSPFVLFIQGGLMGNASFKVALVGFSQNESATFESFFRLAARRAPAYLVQDEVMDAEVLIVNSDNAQALHLVRYADLGGKVLLVGSHDGGTGWPLQRKPVKLVAVLSAMDLLMGLRRVVAPAPAANAPPVAPRNGGDRGFAATEPWESAKAPLLPKKPVRGRGAETEFAQTRPMMRRLATASVPAPRPPAPAAAARPGVMGVTDFGGLEALPTPAAQAPASRFSRSRMGRTNDDRGESSVPEVQRGDVLLVAESLVEGRILHKRFNKYDLAIDWSRDSKQALAMLKAHAYRLVVIDRLSGEPDAYAVCRAAKQRKLPNGLHPVVMMFAPTAGSMDRMKAGLAGSDAYLSRSVAESDLYKMLAQHRLVNLDGFEQTNMGGF